MSEIKDIKFYKALEDIAFSFISKTDLDDILDTILVQIGEIIPYSSANIMLEVNGMLKTVYWKGYDKYGAEDFIKNFSLETARTGKAPLVIKKREIEVIPDTYSDPEWKIFSQTSYIRSAIIAPIMWDDEPIGALFLDHEKPFSFSRDNGEKLKSMVNFASAAINNAKLLNNAHAEIKKRIKAEKKLQEAMEIQQVLIREINHRVRNNLSIIMAMIHMQSDKLYYKYNDYLLDDLERRIHAISLVYDQLYENSNFHAIALDSYIVQIFDLTRNSTGHGEEIRYSFDIPEEMNFGMDTLIPLGLIISEVITNSFKYAFNSTGGIIFVKAEKKDELVKITIRDTGTGFPEEFITKASRIGEAGETSTGLLLIVTLASQLGGTASFFNNEGAVTTITFPLRSKKNLPAS